MKLIESFESHLYRLRYRTANPFSELKNDDTVKMRVFKLLISLATCVVAAAQDDVTSVNIGTEICDCNDAIEEAKKAANEEKQLLVRQLDDLGEKIRDAESNLGDCRNSVGSAQEATDVSSRAQLDIKIRDLVSEREALQKSEEGRQMDSLQKELQEATDDLEESKQSLENTKTRLEKELESQKEQFKHATDMVKKSLQDVKEARQQLAEVKLQANTDYIDVDLIKKDLADFWVTLTGSKADDEL